MKILNDLLIFSFGFLGVFLCYLAPSRSQIIPDSTLPVNSQVTTLEGSTYTIEGGTIAGGNLFHSFSQFSVPSNGAALFNNSSNIQNILTRVTGDSISNIDGLIQANGNASLFLINPNGIVFGPNAGLNIGGSFLASTASSLKFADGVEFSATNPQSTSLLTINVPIGLQLGTSPGNIINRSRATNSGVSSNPIPVGLQVQPGNSLALIGGDVLLEGGILTAAAGNIKVAAVGANNLVSLTNVKTFSLDYGGIQNFQDIQLSNLAQINTSGEGGGNIFLQGRRVSVIGGSQILADTLGSQPGGILSVNASELVEVIGTGPPDGPKDPILESVALVTPVNSRLSTITFGEGTGGDLLIMTGRLVVRDGSEIKAQAFDASVIGGEPFVGGRGGNLTVIARESVEVGGSRQSYNADRYADTNKFFTNLTGLPSDYFLDIGLSSNISTTSISAAQAGNLRIETGRLIVQEGGLVGANTFGSGAGGSLLVNASNSIELIGTGRLGKLPSGITTTSFSLGNAGDITLNTPRLIVRDGAEVNSSTFTPGRAGNLTVNVSEFVDLVGRPFNGLFPSRLTAGTTGEGNAGNITVNTGVLRIRDGAALTVSGTRAGSAGNLSVIADAILLENGGTISAATTTGDLGNIILNSNNIQLRRGSTINTNAGSADGGNITIDTNTLVALENSDITANAIQGSGGQVAISAQGIFGAAFREQLTPESDITATSELGAEFSGTVTLTTPDVDPNAGLVELQSETTDPSDRIIAGCAAADGSSFTLTGRGGLPDDPTIAMRGQTLLSDLRDFSTPATSQTRPADRDRRIAIPQPSPAIEIPLEATSWRVNRQGKIELIAAGEHAASEPPNCQDVR